MVEREALLKCEACRYSLSPCALSHLCAIVIRYEIDHFVLSTVGRQRDLMLLWCLAPSPVVCALCVLLLP